MGDLKYMIQSHSMKQGYKTVVRNMLFYPCLYIYIFAFKKKELYKKEKKALKKT
jgi:hypothetical protein